MKAWVAEKVFQYRHDNVCKQGFLSMFTQSHWIVNEGGLSFHSAANMPVKENGNATKLVLSLLHGKRARRKSGIVDKETLGIFGLL